MKRLLALFLVVSAGLAQDEPEADARDPGALLTDAVLHFRAQHELVVRAQIKHEKAAAQAGGGGVAGGIVILAGPGGVAADPYQGVVEAWRDAEGITVISSEEKIPGFRIFASDKKTVKQITYEDKRPGLKQLETELTSMLEVDRFVQHVMAANTARKLKATVHDSGDVTFTGPIAREIVRPVSNTIEIQGFVVGNLGPQSRVLRAEATFVVTKDGRFRSVAIKLVRSDAMSGMLKGRGIIVQKGGGFVWPQEQKKKKEKHDVEGGSTTYTLTFGDNKPSAQAREFKKKILRTLSADR